MKKKFHCFSKYATYIYIYLLIAREYPYCWMAKLTNIKLDIWRFGWQFSLIFAMQEGLKCSSCLIFFWLASPKWVGSEFPVHSILPPNYPPRIQSVETKFSFETRKQSMQYHNTLAESNFNWSVNYKLPSQRVGYATFNRSNHPRAIPWPQPPLNSIDSVWPGAASINFWRWKFTLELNDRFEGK